MKAAVHLFATAVALIAQNSQFGVRSRLVLVPVNVTDPAGRGVDGLEAPDFVLLDEGRPRKVSVDTADTGVAPIALVVAVQSSGISAAVLEKARDIGVMIQSLVTGERGCAALLSFDERVSWIQDCTNDANALQRAFWELRPGEHKAAHMLDAVQASVERLSRFGGHRRVLLLISESRDRGSEASLGAAAVAAQSAGVTVYAATYSAFKTAFTSKAPVSQPKRPERPKLPNEATGTVNGNPQNRWNPKVPPPEQRIDLLAAFGELARLRNSRATEVLAKVTGGTEYPFTKQKALEEAIGRVGADLHSQYVLSFVPEASAPGYHSLEVRLVRKGEFRIRARPGYWSSEEPRR